MSIEHGAWHITGYSRLAVKPFPFDRSFYTPVSHTIVLSSFLFLASKKVQMSRNYYNIPSNSINFRANKHMKALAGSGAKRLLWHCSTRSVLGTRLIRKDDMWGSPRGFGEQGNMANFSRGTREHETVFGEHGNKTLWKGRQTKLK